METDESTTVKNEPSSQTSTTSSTPVPPLTSISSSSNLNPAQGANPATATTTSTKTKLPSIVLPEVDLYLHLLVLLFAIDKQKYKQVLFIFNLIFILS